MSSNALVEVVIRSSSILCESVGLIVWLEIKIGSKVREADLHFNSIELPDSCLQ